MTDSMVVAVAISLLAITAFLVVSVYRIDRKLDKLIRTVSGEKPHKKEESGDHT